jgi:hypothetical protein
VNYDVIEVNWDSTLVTKVYLKNASKGLAELFQRTRMAPQNHFLKVAPTGKFQVGETTIEFDQNNTYCKYPFNWQTYYYEKHLRPA